LAEICHFKLYGGLEAMYLVKSGDGVCGGKAPLAHNVNYFSGPNFLDKKHLKKILRGGGQISR
jgi:hypothetical protein